MRTAAHRGVPGCEEVSVVLSFQPAKCLRIWHSPGSLVPSVSDAHHVQWSDTKAREFWSICSTELPQLFFSHSVGDLILDVISADLGLDVLEVGCGDGHLARILASKGYRVLGTDISPPKGRPQRSTESARV